MECPSCAREVDANGVHGGELLHLPEGPCVWVTGGRCPYPACTSLVLAYADGGTLVRLVDRATVARAYASRALLDIVASLFAACFAVVFVASPIAAVAAALAHPTRGPGSMLVVIGGTLLTLPAVAFLLIGIVALVQQWRATWAARARVVAGDVGGLSLAPRPTRYRAH